MPVYSNLPNKSVRGCERDRLRLPRSGEGAFPLVLLQHFRGNLDNWDPALVDALSSNRRVDAVCAWGIPDHALLQRLSGIGLPVLVANGDSDPMILPHYSYLLAGLIPQARVKIYPDSAHGFLFQHHAEFAADVDAFLAEPG